MSRPSLLAAALGASLALAPAAAALDPSPEAVLAELPFDGAERNRVIVDLAPPGAKPFPLFLDTGATDSVITPGMARELGVRVRRLKSTPYRRSTVLGRDLQFWIDVDSSDTGSKTGWEYGLLGGRFLAEYVVEIDFPGRRVRFLDRKKYEVPDSVDAPGEAVLPLRIVANRPIVEIGLEYAPVELLIDTGAPDTAVISGKAAKKAGLAWEPLALLRGGTVLGPMDLELAEVKELRLGPFAFGPGFPILIAPKGWYNLGVPSDSVIGYDLLARFALRIDYRRKRVWLRHDGQGEPITLFGADYAAARRSGILITRQAGRHYALLVFPGSPAARIGLESGDAIRAVEGFAAELDPEVIVRAVAAGRGVTVARRVGDDWREIELAGVAGEPPPPVASPPREE